MEHEIHVSIAVRRSRVTAFWREKQLFNRELVSMVTVDAVYDAAKSEHYTYTHRAGLIQLCARDVGKDTRFHECTVTLTLEIDFFTFSS